MQVTVRFFASIRDRAGDAHCTLDLPDGAHLDQALAQVIARYSALNGHEASWHYAINQTHAELDAPLQPGDLVSIFPYIAGG